MATMRNTELVLHLDESPDSAQAKAALDESGVRYRELRVSGPAVPGLEIGNDYFWGLDEVRNIATALGRHRNHTE